MKKVLCLYVSFVLMFCTICASADSVIYPDDYYDNDELLYSNAYKDLLIDYNSGIFGEEVYYLATYGSWGGIGNVAVFKNDGYAKVVLYEGSCYRQRYLTNEEYQDFILFIRENDVDNLPDESKINGADSVVYEYMHFTKDDKASFYIADLDFASEIHTNLIKKFFSLTQTGDFETKYNIQNIPGVKLIIKSEEHKVESVWKDGDDFRVLLDVSEFQNYNNKILNWFLFKDGAVGDQTQRPDCYYNVLSETTRLTVKNGYSSPIKIPNTNWAICQKADNGWVNPRKLVKVNLRTYEEIELSLPKAQHIEPQSILNGKVLIGQADGGVTQYYLYDGTDDSFEMVQGDFSCLSNVYIKSRHLQKSYMPNKCYALVDGYTVGLFDEINYTFTKLARLPFYIEDNDHMWIDEENKLMYVVTSSGSLISYPFNPEVPSDGQTTFKLKDKEISFNESPVTVNNRILVPVREFCNILGANVFWVEESNQVIINKGDTIVLFEIGEESFYAADVSEYQTANDLYAELQSANISSILSEHKFDVASQIKNGRTYAPIRDICSALGVSVQWLNTNRCVDMSCSMNFLIRENKDPDFIQKFILALSGKDDIK